MAQSQAFGEGYRVRSALSTTPEEAAELIALTGAQGNFQLSGADLMDYGDLTRAFQGCSAVFLTTPSADSLNGLKEYPAEIIESEVRSTLNVVEACANTSSVKRLILTSCASTIAFDSYSIKVGRWLTSVAGVTWTSAEKTSCGGQFARHWQRELHGLWRWTEDWTWWSSTLLLSLVLSLLMQRQLNIASYGWKMLISGPWKINILLVVFWCFIAFSQARSEYASGLVKFRNHIPIRPEFWSFGVLETHTALKSEGSKIGNKCIRYTSATPIGKSISG